MEVRADHLEVYYKGRLVERMDRVHGAGQARIDYRHVIGSLVRKPGAFARYRYREHMFPTETFRLAYDALREWKGERADVEYVRILHLAATTMESGVARALRLLLDAGCPSTTRRCGRSGRMFPSWHHRDRSLRSAIKQSRLERSERADAVVQRVQAAHGGSGGSPPLRRGRSRRRPLDSPGGVGTGSRGPPAAAIRLRRASKLPVGKTWDTFEHDRVPVALRQQLGELVDGSFVERGVNLLAFGLAPARPTPCAP